jgi:hypothetical protein
MELIKSFLTRFLVKNEKLLEANFKLPIQWHHLERRATRAFVTVQSLIILNSVHHQNI